MALTALVPPLPSEFMVIASGALAAEGLVPIHGAFFATFAGCLAGDIGLYALFRYKFIRVLYRWRWGRLLHRKILRISLHAGGPSTWAGLLVVFAMPFGRSAAMATAGMMRMSWARLLSLAITGGFMWSWWLIGLGFLPTSATDLPPWLSTVLGITVGSAAGAAIAYIGTRRRRAQRQHRLEASPRKHVVPAGEPPKRETTSRCQIHPTLEGDHS
ncbi:DedA family protein [Nesterenkonia haasae]|uniref:DedA family protein n=1 Tax=Nesterenkonia haasae TaxID=2587813 RepID=UPI0013913825|nr:VTT domain-containing protein [Nesterenkonia haasae]